MKATELLEKQHREVEKLFERFEKASGDKEKSAIYDEIAKNLVAHDAIEREIFYPACEREIDEEDVLRESLVEHGLVEFCLFRADKNRNKKLASYVKVLKEVVEHHVEEEEDELLPKMKNAMEGEQLEELGAKMEQRFKAAIQADWKKPLRDNLTQVLAGRMKTVKKSGTKAQPRARVAAKKPRRAASTRSRTTRAKGGRTTRRASRR